MKCINRVTLLGRVGQDPKVIETKQGSKFATFSLATSSSYKNKSNNQWITNTEWHSIVVYNPIFVEKIATSVHKGSIAYIEGELITSSFTDKQAQERKKIDIVLKAYKGDLILLDVPSEKNEHQDIKIGGDFNGDFNFDDQLNDDIPF